MIKYQISSRKPLCSEYKFQHSNNIEYNLKFFFLILFQKYSLNKDAKLNITMLFLQIFG